MKTDPFDLPIGTVIELNGVTAEKEHDSFYHPWPWTYDGLAMTDEWARGLLSDGGTARNPKVAR